MAPATGNPTGTVTLSVDGRVFGTYALDSTADSQAVVITSTLATGAHTMTAVYNGDSNFTGSTGSSSAQQVVGAAVVPGPPNAGAQGRSGSLLLSSLLIVGGALILVLRRRLA